MGQVSHAFGDSKFRVQSSRLKAQSLCFYAFCSMLFAFYISLFAVNAEASIGKITRMEGQVEILRDGKLPAIAAKVGDVINVKDIIRTKSNSKAEVVFNDGNVLKIAQRSRIDITEYSLDGQSKAVMDMPRGKVEAKVDKRVTQRIAESPTANKFEIRTPVAVAGVRGTEYFTFHERGVTGVLVKEGRVETYNPKFPEQKVVVAAGHMTTVAENRPPAPPKPATEEEKQKHEKDITIAEKPKDRTEDKKEDTPKTAKAEESKPATQEAAPTTAQAESTTQEAAPTTAQAESTTQEAAPTTAQQESTTAITATPTTDTATGTTTTTTTTTTDATTTVAAPPPPTMDPFAPPPPSTTTDITTTTYVPPPPPPPPITEITTITTTTTTTTNFTGSMLRYFFANNLAKVTGSYSAATLSGSFPYNGASGTGGFTLTGYSNPSGYNLWGGEFSGTTDKNGAFYGIFAGTTTQADTYANLAYEHLAGFYIEDNIIGFIRADLSGSLSGDTLTGSGSWSKAPLTGTNLSPLPSAISANIVSNHFTFTDSWSIFTPNGNISFGSSNHSATLWNLNPSVANNSYLGLWQDVAVGSGYSNANSITSVTGPMGQAIIDTSAGFSSYQVENGSFTDNLSGKFTLSKIANYMELKENADINFDGNPDGVPLGLIGTTSVSYTGIYSSPTGGNYYMAGAGTKNVSPMLYMAKFKEGGFGEIVDLYTDDGISINSNITGGLAGGMYSLYLPSPSFKSMGKLDDSYPYQDNSGLFTMDFYGRTMSSADTSDGAFYLITSGIVGRSDHSSMLAKAVGLYIKNDGSTGMIKSSLLSGNVYKGINMYELSGTLSSQQKTGSTTYGPDNIVNTTFAYSGSALKFDGANEYTTGWMGYFSAGDIQAGDLYGHDIKIYADANGNVLPWGIFYNYFTGTYSSIPTSNYTAKAGGYTTDLNEDVDSYWIGNLSGSAWNASNGTFTGQVTGTYIGRQAKGSFTGDFLGIFESGTYSGTTIGTYNEEPLKYVTDYSGSGVGSSGIFSNYIGSDFSPYSSYSLFFYMGDTTSLWSGSGTNIPLTMIGKIGGSNYNLFWSTPIQPVDYSATGNNRRAAYDNGTYYGYMIGIDTIANSSKQGLLYAAYIDKDAGAGILKGSFSGTNYPDIYMFDASGTINRVGLGTSDWTSDDLAGTTIYDNIYNEISYGQDIYWSGSGSGFDNESWGGFAKSTDDLITKLNVQESWEGSSNRVDWGLKISGLKGKSGILDWGTFNFLSKAKYTPSLANKNYLLGMRAYWEDGSNNLQNIITYATRGDTWAGGKLTGRGNGALATWDFGVVGGSPFTAVLHGDTYGAYNDDLQALGAATTGAWIKTGVFRQMVDDTSTGGGREKLSSLGFPSIEVGTRLLLSGGGGVNGNNIALEVGDGTNPESTDAVRFFAYNANEFPKIWIANKVAGTYSGTINTSVKAYLEGGNDGNNNDSLFGSFSIKRWESNNYLADIEFVGGTVDSNILQGWFFGVSAGTYDTSTSTFSGTAVGFAEPANALSQILIDLTGWDGTSKTSEGTLWGVMASFSIWNLPVSASNPFEFEFIGVHSPLDSVNNPHVWYWSIEPYNYLQSGAKTTTDGGSYYGWVGGYQLPIDTSTGMGRIDAAFYALYVDPDKNIGILRGANPDTAYNYIYSDGTNGDGYWSLDLNGYTVQMGSDTNIVPANFAGTYLTIHDTGETILPNGNINFYSDATYSNLYGSATVSLNSSYTRWKDANITGQDWGIYQMYLAGTWDTAYTTNYWILELLPQTSAVQAGNAIINIETWGTKWGPSADQNLLATQRGYFADITGTPKTGIYAGELKGTFDATSATWQAVSTGVWIETNKLLSMACPNGTCNQTGTNLTAAQQALKNLNIPVVEVGRANFSGSGNNLTVNMNDVIFLANQSGEKATMWATGSVSGTYSAAPTIGTAVSLSGGSAGSVDFTPQAWANNKWMATINGTGINLGSSPNNSLTVKGAGAGTYDTGTFSGTAAGTAR
ncbi:hypothetical protein A45J_1132 [hot springs metagenome]|uniref:FecR protein domain-containing protein n=1 Tax=hot springs metagenome TaxID=433727 RepID=A0A5J4L0W4_9ZZZZ